MFENYKSIPRFAKKVIIMDAQGVKRNTSLGNFDKFLDFETHGHRYFICGEIILYNTLSRDHVTPWSYLYSDDLLNLVYVHKTFNSRKRSFIPSIKEVTKLKERNKTIQNIINEKVIKEGLNKGSVLENFDYAVYNDHVD